MTVTDEEHNDAYRAFVVARAKGVSDFDAIGAALEAAEATRPAPDDDDDLPYEPARREVLPLVPEAKVTAALARAEASEQREAELREALAPFAE